MNIRQISKKLFSNRNVFLIITLLLAQGCVEDWRVEPIRVDQSFGKTVTTVTAAQIYDKESARNPRSEPVKRLDGTVGEGVLNSLRERNSIKKEVTSVNINLGGSGQQ